MNDDRNETYTYLSDNGDTLQINQFREMEDFVNGYSIVKVSGMDGHEDGYGVIDQNGTFAIESGIYDTIRRENEYFFAIKDNGQATVFDLQMQELFSGEYQGIRSLLPEGHPVFECEKTDGTYEYLLHTTSGESIALTTATNSYSVTIEFTGDCMYYVSNVETGTKELYSALAGQKLPDTYLNDSNKILDHMIWIKNENGNYDVLTLDDEANPIATAHDIKLGGSHIFQNGDGNFVVEGGTEEAIAYSKDGEQLATFQHNTIAQYKDYEDNIWYVSYHSGERVTVYNASFAEVFSLENVSLKSTDVPVTRRYLSVTQIENGKKVDMMYDWDGTLIAKDAYCYELEASDAMYLIVDSIDGRDSGYNIYSASTDEILFHFDATYTGSRSTDEKYQTFFYYDSANGNQEYIVDLEEGKILSEVDASLLGDYTYFVDDMHILENENGYYDLQGNLIYSK